MLLASRYRNKGTAFTEDERDRLGLRGLLPPAVEDLDTQLDRVRLEYDTKRTDLGRHVFLRALQGHNSVLFYRFLADNIEELLPVVYTPTVGHACQEWSHTYRREHGLYVTLDDAGRIDELLDNLLGDQPVDVVVVTDGERILGLGDQGVGGMGIPIGKLALYSCIGGLNPSRTLPVLLDVGTDNEALLSDPLYLGTRQPRVRGGDYDALVDAFVDALARRCPGVLLQWEDFAQHNAARLLARHRDRICSFNDDIQGTAAVAMAAITAGLAASGRPTRELRLVVVGAGSAGLGIATEAVRALVAEGLSEDEAVRRCWLVDRDGLLHLGLASLTPGQVPFARPWSEVEAWDVDGDGHLGLAETVRRVAPHALVGVTGVSGLFSEEVVRAHAAAVDRPIVLPLSNPTPRCEAFPADVLAWTGGRALVGTGSPFPPVPWEGVEHHIAQVNNAYVFPGVGLGVIAVRARVVTDGMMTAAAAAVGHLVPVDRGWGAPLLPPLVEARAVARAVAVAVARQAIADGVADQIDVDDDRELEERVTATMWEPVYRPA
jgi:malate dehydrogenase (oxaloacetate-decarboxylating)